MIMCQIKCRRGSALQGIAEEVPFRPWIQVTFAFGSTYRSSAHALCGNCRIWIYIFDLGCPSVGLARRTPLRIV